MEFTIKGLGEILENLEKFYDLFEKFHDLLEHSSSSQGERLIKALENIAVELTNMELRDEAFKV